MVLVPLVPVWANIGESVAKALDEAQGELEKLLRFKLNHAGALTYMGKIFTGILFLFTGALLGVGYVYDTITLNDQVEEINLE